MRSFLLLGVLAAACSAADPQIGDDPTAAPQTQARKIHAVRPSTKGDAAGILPASAASESLAISVTPLGPAYPGPGNRISYQGGQVLANPKAYVIFYGNWLGQASHAVLVDNLLRGLGATAYWGINATYTDTSGHAVGPITFGADYLDGRTDQNPDPLSVVRDAILGGHLPYDANGIYMVMTSSDIALDGFCSEFCGWHTHDLLLGTLDDHPLRYGFVGEPPSTCGGCIWPFTTPNGAPIDSMISALTHELEEAATDPDLNAYTDLSGNENADECAWDFVDEARFQFTSANGGKANIHVGTNDFFIQPNWVNASGGYCGMAADRKRIAIQIPASPGGSVSGSGITCNGGECDFLYLTNSVLTYTATPPSGYQLATFANCDSLSGNTCTLTLNTDRGILPGFVRKPSCHLDQVCYNDCSQDCDDLPVRQRLQCQASCRNQCTVCP